MSSHIRLVDCLIWGGLRENHDAPPLQLAPDHPQDLIGVDRDEQLVRQAHSE